MRQKYHQTFRGRRFESSQILSFLVILLCMRFSHCEEPQPETPTPKEPEAAAAASLTSSSSNGCNQLLPGLHKLRLGVDITNLDLLPLSFTTNDGFKYPVIDFSCTEGKTRHLNNVKYDLPDQVISVTNKPAAILSSEVKILKKSSDVLKVMSDNVGFSGITKGLFSASASYKRMTSTFYNESRYVERIVSHQSTRTAKLLPQFALKLGKYAKMYVDRFLPASFESDPEKYFKFIENFGTHYFAKLYFGGILQFYLETKKSYYQGKSDSAVKAEASATFFNFLKANGGHSQSVKKVDTRFTESTNKLIRYYGGDTNLLAVAGMSKWQPTITKNPWTFGGKLVSLGDLIEDQSKRESMEKATRIYIDKAYIASLLELLNWAANKYVPFIPQITTYRNQVKALKPSDHDAITKLGAKLEEELQVPSWFLDDVKLCYKWRPDGDGGQCGGGVGRHLCANVGSMTTYYRDDTDRRGGGCRMQWGIQKSGHVSQSWLQQTKICYRWWPDGDGGQCGGGAARNLCASINKFTSEYRDDTDRRGGGCRMQWSLVVPDSAPIWYRSMKLCFEWYADGDGGQCGGGAARLLCATANGWTAAYRDDTDRRGGGCRMRWGIIPS